MILPFGQANVNRLGQGPAGSSVTANGKPETGESQAFAATFPTLAERIRYAPLDDGW
jgi:hypothetical protein